MQKPHFLNFSRLEYRQLFKDWGFPAFRADQVSHWIYKANVRDPEQMSNLSKDLRQKLFTELDWHMPEVVSKLDSVDGSSKLLLKSHKGHSIESVILRYDGRTSLCVSSQVGCKLACDFCQTGKLGFVRHLERGEILAQMYLANEIIRPEGLRITHVVFMGMGEPLDNYDQAVGAANVMMAEDGFFLSARHVTLSSSGLAPEIEKLAVDSRASLALSLHAARDDLRSSLMPINRRLHGLRTKVNLIPFNAHPGMPYDRPSDEDIRSFQKYLADRSIPAPVRYSKGLDVSAACGQLAAKFADSIHEKPARNRLLSGLASHQSPTPPAPVSSL
ncbi:MAG: 23S rRNA (adenine(2503)-C(2))-methyltransferase RlmN [Proteobacteria bacterium]|nr:23S rRNA (adenine(2503)-C(2))-methyltransferase RlmN [Pseudomonadota bacterium]